MKRGRKPLIKKVGGQWYAYGKKGRHGGFALGSAISFCGKLNRASQEQGK